MRHTQHGTWSIQAHAARNAACDLQRDAARDDRIAPSGSSAPLRRLVAAAALAAEADAMGERSSGAALPPAERDFELGASHALAFCTGGGVPRHDCPRGSLETACPSAGAAGSATHATGHRAIFARARSGTHTRTAADSARAVIAELRARTQRQDRLLDERARERQALISSRLIPSLAARYGLIRPMPLIGLLAIRNKAKCPRGRGRSNLRSKKPNHPATRSVAF